MDKLSFVKTLIEFLEQKKEFSKSQIINDLGVTKDTTEYFVVLLDSKKYIVPLGTETFGLSVLFEELLKFNRKETLQDLAKEITFSVEMEESDNSSFNMEYYPPCMKRIMNSVRSRKLNDVEVEYITSFLKQIGWQDYQIESTLRQYDPQYLVEILRKNLSLTCKSCKAVHLCYPCQKCNNIDTPADYFRLRKQEFAWDNIHITELRVYPGSKTYYEIIIQGKTISLTEEEISTPNKFRLSYFNTFHVMPKPLSNKKWAETLTDWSQTKSKIMKEKSEAISEEQIVVDAVLEYIEQAKIVKEIEGSFREGLIYINGSEIFIPSEIIGNILQRINPRITFRKLSYLLDKYISRGTQVIPVSGKSKRFWIFNSDKFNLDNKLQISLYEKKEAKDDTS